MSENAAVLRGVTFRYANGEQGALNSLDLEIKRGECVLLCGSSGCGKTTVTRLLNGLIPHYYEGKLSGAVTVLGRDIRETAIEELAGAVGSVFQNPRSQFFCVDTTAELAFGCENMGLPEAEIRRRMDKTVSGMRIEGLLGRSIFNLSGGEKQKIACAGVAAMLPELIVLDEPTSNLDLDAIDELREVIAAWRSQAGLWSSRSTASAGWTGCATGPYSWRTALFRQNLRARTSSHSAHKSSTAWDSARCTRTDISSGAKRDCTR